MIRLETERLIIRDHIADDLEAHHRLISNDDVMFYIQDIQTHTIEESKKNLDFSIMESKKDDRSCYFFAIIDKVTNAHIGSTGFTILEEGCAELGYFIHEKCWGKGYTTEAVKAVLVYAFEVLTLHKIITGCVYENSQSEHIMKKLGMYKEAHLYRHVYLNGKWKDRVEYGYYNDLYLTTLEKQRLLMVDLAQKLRHSKYHFDGSTAVVAFGLDVEMDDIDITFPYDDELMIRDYFRSHDLSETMYCDGYKHFFFHMNNEKIHCLFYKGDKSIFSNEDDIAVLYDVPIVYKSMSFYLRYSKNEELNKRIEAQLSKLK